MMDDVNDEWLFYKIQQLKGSSAFVYAAVQADEVHDR